MCHSKRLRLVSVPVVIVQVLKEETLEVVLEANLEHLAKDHRQTEEIEVVPERIHGRENDKNVVDHVEDKLVQQPNFA